MPETREQFIEQAIAEYESPLIRFAATILHDTNRARDVVEDTFIRLCQQDISKIRPNLKSWLSTVCRNRARDLLRKDKRTQPIEQIQWKKVAGPGLQSDKQADSDEHPAPGTATLHPRQRETILRAARHADEVGEITTRPSPRKPLKLLLVLLAAAAIIAPAAFLLIRLPSRPASNTSTPPPPSIDLFANLPLEIALLPAPGPADTSPQHSAAAHPTASSKLIKSAAARAAAMEKNGDLFLQKVAERLSSSPPPTAAELPLLTPRGSVSAPANPSLPLPIYSGRASLGWITHSILQEHKRPPAAAIRTEEILNHFTLRPAGAAAISHGVTLSSESISCPWKPSATLLFISFRGASDTAREISATFMADTSGVRSYRLLGFAPVSGIPPDKLPTHLPAKSITSLVLEIEPSTATGDLGTIEWSVNGQNSAPVTIVRHGEAEPSDDARFAALVCTYAQWLTGESSSMIDADLLSALARETAAENLPANRMDFLNLIDRSIDL